MTIKTLFFLCTAMCFHACNIESDPAPQRNKNTSPGWRLIEYEGMGYCEFSIDQDGDTPTSSYNLTMDELLGFSDNSPKDMTLQFTSDHRFNIVKDGKNTVSGELHQAGSTISLIHERGSVTFEKISESSDTLILFTNMYYEGITDVTIVFIKEQ